MTSLVPLDSSSSPSTCLVHLSLFVSWFLVALWFSETNQGKTFEVSHRLFIPLRKCRFFAEDQVIDMTRSKLTKSIFAKSIPDVSEPVGPSGCRAGVTEPHSPGAKHGVPLPESRLRMLRRAGKPPKPTPTTSIFAVRRTRLTLVAIAPAAPVCISRYPTRRPKDVP